MMSEESIKSNRDDRLVIFRFYRRGDIYAILTLNELQEALDDLWEVRHNDHQDDQIAVDRGDDEPGRGGGTKRSAWGIRCEMGNAC